MSDYDTIKGDLIKFLGKPVPKKYSLGRIFQEIWDERTHKSELSGSPLYYKGHLKWHWQFLHVLPKGAYPSFKYFKWNIMLGTDHEHERQDRYKAFTERKEILKRLYHELI